MKTIQDTNPAEKVPAMFKPFAGKTPAQFLEKYISSEKMEMLAGGMAGFIDLGIALPEWVKKSSIQFWKNYIGDRPLDPFNSAEDFGVLVKMVGLFAQGKITQPKPIMPPSKLEKFVDSIAGKFYSLVMKKIVADFSDVEKSQFYAGCVRAEKIIETFQNFDHLAMVKRAKVYIVIAFAWRKIEGCKTHIERERWLREHIVEEKEPLFANEAKRDIWLQSNEGQKFSAKRLVSREYYDIFKIIELPGAAPGRPKKPETRAGEIVES